MSSWIAGAILGLGAAAIGEAIWINGRMRRFLTYAEQLLNVGAHNVAQQPSKSAAPTPADDQPTGPIPSTAQIVEAEWRQRFGLVETPRSDT